MTDWPAGSLSRQKGLYRLRIEAHSQREHRNGTIEPARYCIMQDPPNDKIVHVTLPTLADAALISRYLDGAPLPDSECLRAQDILHSTEPND